MLAGNREGFRLHWVIAAELGWGVRMPGTQPTTSLDLARPR